MADANEPAISDAELNKRTSSHIENSRGRITSSTTNPNHILAFLDIAHDEATRDIDQSGGGLEERAGTVHNYRSIAGAPDRACGTVESIVRKELGSFDVNMRPDWTAGYLTDTHMISVNT
jgi:hypothetical protein